ncbi:cell division protein anillin-domain-containing protein [Kalaharituber pfeilii]|nr:cell division protein anillin-domain-containing protein [Kalaharituber pfeilii]
MFDTARLAARSPDAVPEAAPSECSEASEFTNGTDASRYSEAEEGDSDATPTAGTPRAASPDLPAPAAAPLSDPTENTPALPMPVPASPPTPPKEEDEVASKRVSVALPEFRNDFGGDSLGLRDFMTPSPPPIKAPESEPTPVPSPEPTPFLSTMPSLPPPLSETREYLDRRPSTPENQHIELDDDLERTPESVIHRPASHNDDDSEYDQYYDEDGTEDGEGFDREGESEADRESMRTDTPVVVEPARSPSPIPEDAATIRAPGGKLRTRPSATPADMAAMAAQRRQVSGDHTKTMSPKSDSGSVEGDDAPESEGDYDDEDYDEEEDEVASDPGVDSNGKTPMRKSSRRSLKMPTLDELHIDLSLDDIDEELDRVIETSKRGYLMRHSTRVIHATSRESDEENSRMQGHQRTRSWQVEPWKSPSSRRRSQRSSLGQGDKKQDGPAPPMPGQPDAATKTHLAPPSTAPAIDDKNPITPPENGERGRLFVKVIGVKDLTLPLPQREPTWFCLTLDNGLHCVTTSWLELAKNAPIGQEFELVVLNDLEFQLTLQTKLEKPPPKVAPAAPPTPPPPAPKVTTTSKTKSTFSRVFISKKRKELEKQREQQQLQLLQQQQQAQAQAQKQQPEEPLSAWELLNGLVARDGSFARSYVCLKDFEHKAYGRPFVTEINCFNEWAIDSNSLKSKRGGNPARRPPYKIGKLEVQMLFVPKPPGMSDKDLPKSMAAAIRELKEAESMVARSWEGYLSQQGGDCPYWRRRYFKLVGAKLTAYHEVSRQPRATINLAKAIRLIDDRPSLTEPEIASSNGKRRKSAFSEMEEGYMFVEEGFRIKFGNGETIDFYADNAEDKKGWMKVLGETIGGGQENRNWCEIILAKEKHDREQAAAAQQRRIQQQQAQHQQFEKSYLPQLSSNNGPPPPPKTAKRPVSGVPAGYPQGSIGSVHSVGSTGR